MAVPAELVAALEAAGARPASPGEFTRRAVLNGKMDLVQAEAVGDLIDATAPAQAGAALAQLEGGLSRRLGGLRERRIEVQALLGYDIDFPGEDDGPIAPARIAQALAAAARLVQDLLATAPSGERLREGALVVFAGRPNTGKSSLFNALLGSERALVTEIPGTTRDAIEAHTDFLGWPVRLADTAGLQDAVDRVERLGIEVSHRYLGAANLVLLCAEVGRPLGADECAILERRPVILVRTKSDLLAGPAPDQLAVSAVTGHGLGTEAGGRGADLRGPDRARGPRTGTHPGATSRGIGAGPGRTRRRRAPFGARRRRGARGTSRPPRDAGTG